MEVEIHVSHSASVDPPGPLLLLLGIGSCSAAQVLSLVNRGGQIMVPQHGSKSRLFMALAWVEMDHSLHCGFDWSDYCLKGFCFPIGLHPLARESGLLLGFLVIPFGISSFFTSNSWKNEAKENPKNSPPCCSLGPRVSSWRILLYLLFKWHSRFLVVLSRKNRKKYINASRRRKQYPPATHTYSAVCGILVS